MRKKDETQARIIHRKHSSRRREDGVVAIVAALTLVALMGFAGLVLDLGRLYVNKTELQNAADACALAAANELVCEPGFGACLENAERAGIFTGSRNKANFQASPVAMLPDDIKFDTTNGPATHFLSRTHGARAEARFAMCTAQVTGIVPWFMGVLGVGAQSVAATAVATLAPGQTSCNAAPLGICAINPAGPGFGFVPGAWIASNYTHTGNTAYLVNGLRWIDFQSGAGGARQVQDQLMGDQAACGIVPGATIRTKDGASDARKAWNTRFGIYTGDTRVTSAAPDKTGYAYPSRDSGLNVSAYANYRSQQALRTPFTAADYTPDSSGISTPISAASHLAHGAERRLIAVPVIDCLVPAPASAPILGMACALMLNPMANGGSGTVYLEWRGLASDAASPCHSAGLAGGTSGALVTTLVQ
jgi:hypothetical protein